MCALAIMLHQLFSTTLTYILFQGAAGVDAMSAHNSQELSRGSRRTGRQLGGCVSQCYKPLHTGGATKLLAEQRQQQPSASALKEQRHDCHCRSLGLGDHTTADALPW